MVRRAPPGVVVWTVWVVMTTALVACVWAYTFNMPLAEDWHLVPAMTGHQSGLWTWLWEQNNEHRLPLPRLVLLAVLMPTRDFRWGMAANIALMSATAFAILWTLARRRGGQLRYADAFIPIALLHIGNWENYMWAWQLCFVLSSAITLTLLLAIDTADLWTSRWRAALVAVTVTALPVCGANGLAFAAPVAAWLALESIVRCRRQRRGASAIVWAGIALGVAESIYYFVGYTHATWNPPSPGPLATLKTALKFLALSFGPAIKSAPALWAIALLAVLAAATLLVARAALAGTADERVRAARLLAYVAGVATLALAFGWGRAGLVPTVGLPDRYVLLAVPALIWAYLVVETYASRPVRTGLQGLLLLAACVLLPSNTREGFTWRDWYRDGMQSVMRDLDAGMSRDDLVRRHAAYLMAWSPERLATGMQMLHDARIGPFASMRQRPSTLRVAAKAP